MGHCQTNYTIDYFHKLFSIPSPKHFEELPQKQTNMNTTIRITLCYIYNAQLLDSNFQDKENRIFSFFQEKNFFQKIVCYIPFFYTFAAQSR